MKKEKNNSNFIAIVIAGLVLVVSLTAFLVSFLNRPFYIRELEVRFEISEESAGVNLDRVDLLDFGRISPQSAAIGRMVELTNNKEFPISVNTVFSEEIQGFFSIPAQEVIAPGESKNISIWISAPSEAEFGNYSGTVKFVLRAHKG